MYEVKFDKGNMVVIKRYDDMVTAITEAVKGNGIIISEGR